ncbi:hypothetical protein PCE1_002963 [Barthelona sp. PCE]
MYDAYPSFLSEERGWSTVSSVDVFNTSRRVEVFPTDLDRNLRVTVRAVRPRVEGRTIVVRLTLRPVLHKVENHDNILYPGNSVQVEHLANVETRLRFEIFKSLNLSSISSSSIDAIISSDFSANEPLTLMVYPNIPTEMTMVFLKYDDKGESYDRRAEISFSHFYEYTYCPCSMEPGLWEIILKSSNWHDESIALTASLEPKEVVLLSNNSFFQSSCTSTSYMYFELDLRNTEYLGSFTVDFEINVGHIPMTIMINRNDLAGEPSDSCCLNYDFKQTLPAYATVPLKMNVPCDLQHEHYFISIKARGDSTVQESVDFSLDVKFTEMLDFKKLEHDTSTLVQFSETHRFEVFEIPVMDNVPYLHLKSASFLFSDFELEDTSQNILFYVYHSESPLDPATNCFDHTDFIDVCGSQNLTSCITSVIGCALLKDSYMYIVLAEDSYADFKLRLFFTFVMMQTHSIQTNSIFFGEIGAISHHRFVLDVTEEYKENDSLRVKVSIPNNHLYDIALRLQIFDQDVHTSCKSYYNLLPLNSDPLVETRVLGFNTSIYLHLPTCKTHATEYYITLESLAQVNEVFTLNAELMSLRTLKPDTVIDVDLPGGTYQHFEVMLGKSNSDAFSINLYLQSAGHLPIATQVSLAPDSIPGSVECFVKNSDTRVSSLTPTRTSYFLLSETDVLDDKKRWFLTLFQPVYFNDVQMDQSMHITIYSKKSGSHIEKISKSSWKKFKMSLRDYRYFLLQHHSPLNFIRVEVKIDEISMNPSFHLMLSGNNEKPIATSTSNFQYSTLPNFDSSKSNSQSIHLDIHPCAIPFENIPLSASLYLNSLALATSQISGEVRFLKIPFVILKEEERRQIEISDFEKIFYGKLESKLDNVCTSTIVFEIETEYEGEIELFIRIDAHAGPFIGCLGYDSTHVFTSTNKRFEITPCELKAGEMFISFRVPTPKSDAIELKPIYSTMHYERPTLRELTKDSSFDEELTENIVFLYDHAGTFEVFSLFAWSVSVTGTDATVRVAPTGSGEKCSHAYSLTVKDGAHATISATCCLFGRHYLSITPNNPGSAARVVLKSSFYNGITDIGTIKVSPGAIRYLKVPARAHSQQAEYVLLHLPDPKTAHVVYSTNTASSCVDDIGSLVSHGTYFAMYDEHPLISGQQVLSVQYNAVGSTIQSTQKTVELKLAATVHSFVHSTISAGSESTVMVDRENLPIIRFDAPIYAATATIRIKDVQHNLCVLHDTKMPYTSLMHMNDIDEDICYEVCQSGEECEIELTEENFPINLKDSVWAIVPIEYVYEKFNVKVTLDTPASVAEIIVQDNGVDVTQPNFDDTFYEIRTNDKIGQTSGYAFYCDFTFTSDDGEITLFEGGVSTHRRRILSVSNKKRRVSFDPVYRYKLYYLMVEGEGSVDCRKYEYRFGELSSPESVKQTVTVQKGNYAVFSIKLTSDLGFGAEIKSSITPFSVYEDKKLLATSTKENVEVHADFKNRDMSIRNLIIVVNNGDHYSGECTMEVTPFRSGIYHSVTDFVYDQAYHSYSTVIDVDIHRPSVIGVARHIFSRSSTHYSISVNVLNVYCDSLQLYTIKSDSKKAIEAGVADPDMGASFAFELVDNGELGAFYQDFVIILATESSTKSRAKIEVVVRSNILTRISFDQWMKCKGTSCEYNFLPNLSGMYAQIYVESRQECKIQFATEPDFSNIVSVASDKDMWSYLQLPHSETGFISLLYIRVGGLFTTECDFNFHLYDAQPKKIDARENPVTIQQRLVCDVIHVFELNNEDIPATESMALVKVDVALPLIHRESTHSGEFTVAIFSSTFGQKVYDYELADVVVNQRFDKSVGKASFMAVLPPNVNKNHERLFVTVRFEPDIRGQFDSSMSPPVEMEFHSLPTNLITMDIGNSDFYSFSRATNLHFRVPVKMLADANTYVAEFSLDDRFVPSDDANVPFCVYVTAEGVPVYEYGKVPSPSSFTLYKCVEDLGEKAIIDFRELLQDAVVGSEQQLYMTVVSGFDGLQTLLVSLERKKIATLVTVNRFTDRRIELECLQSKSSEKRVYALETAALKETEGDKQKFLKITVYALQAKELTVQIRPNPYFSTLYKTQDVFWQCHINEHDTACTVDFPSVSMYDWLYVVFDNAEHHSLQIDVYDSSVVYLETNVPKFVASVEQSQIVSIPFKKGHGVDATFIHEASLTFEVSMTGEEWQPIESLDLSFGVSDVHVSPFYLDRADDSVTHFFLRMFSEHCISTTITTKLSEPIATEGTVSVRTGSGEYRGMRLKVTGIKPDILFHVNNSEEYHAGCQGLEVYMQSGDLLTRDTKGVLDLYIPKTHIYNYDKKVQGDYFLTLFIKSTIDYERYSDSMECLISFKLMEAPVIPFKESIIVENSVRSFIGNRLVRIEVKPMRDISLFIIVGNVEYSYELEETDIFFEYTFEIAEPTTVLIGVTDRTMLRVTSNSVTHATTQFCGEKDVPDLVGDFLSYRGIPADDALLRNEDAMIRFEGWKANLVNSVSCMGVSQDCLEALQLLSCDLSFPRYSVNVLDTPICVNHCSNVIAHCPTVINQTIPLSCESNRFSLEACGLVAVDSGWSLIVISIISLSVILLAVLSYSIFCSGGPQRAQDGEEFINLI